MTAEHSPPGLYVHIPFCRSRCQYCGFVSGDYVKTLADKYIRALSYELQAREVFSESIRPSTLFIGGGTPSVLSSAQLAFLLKELPRPLGEATCEVNPDSIDREKLQILREFGINRLSFGVQTFSDAGLKLLGRIHNAETALQAVHMAADEGFETLSIDLINNWPQQDDQSILNDLRISVNLPIRHLSYYSLILDPSSVGYMNLFRLMSQDEVGEDTERRFWDFIELFMENNGFIHYETSNYALSDYKCEHNVQIWKGGEYLGLGISAHSHLNGRRFSNTEDIDAYIGNSRQPKAIEVFSEQLTGVAKAMECAVFWLRLADGIDAAEFTQKTGFTLEELYGDTLVSLEKSGLVEWGPDRATLRVPKRFQPVLDSILVELV